MVRESKGGFPSNLHGDRHHVGSSSASSSHPNPVKQMGNGHQLAVSGSSMQAFLNLQLREQQARIAQLQLEVIECQRRLGNPYQAPSSRPTLAQANQPLPGVSSHAVGPNGSEYVGHPTEMLSSTVSQFSIASLTICAVFNFD